MLFLALSPGRLLLVCGYRLTLTKRSPGLHKVPALPATAEKTGVADHLEVFIGDVPDESGTF